MKRWVRRLAWIGIALTLVGLALGVTEHFLATLPGVTAANLERIQEGMVLPEVEAIMGPKAEPHPPLDVAAPQAAIRGLLGRGKRARYGLLRLQ